MSSKWESKQFSILNPDNLWRVIYVVATVVLRDAYMTLGIDCWQFLGLGTWHSYQCSSVQRVQTLDPSRSRKKPQNSRLLRIPHSTFCSGWKDCIREQNQNANIRLHEIFILSELQLRKRGIKIKRRIFHHITNLKSSVSGCLNITN